MNTPCPLVGGMSNDKEVVDLTKENGEAEESTPKATAANEETKAVEGDPPELPLPEAAKESAPKEPEQTVTGPAAPSPAEPAAKKPEQEEPLAPVVKEPGQEEPPAPIEPTEPLAPAKPPATIEVGQDTYESRT